MPIDITMPALSPTMEEGKLAKWHVKEGDSVSSGDVIAEIETDKATMEVEAVDEGKIGRIVVAEGTDNVKVNSVIAVLLQDGEAADTAASAAKPEAEKPAPPPAAAAPTAPGGEAGAIMRENPATQIAAADGGAGVLAYDRGTASGARPGAAQQASPMAVAKANGTGGEGGRIFASPLARRLAKERGIDLSSLSGSGPHGRIVRADIESARAGKAAPATVSPAAPTPAGAGVAGGMTGAQVRALYPEGSYDAVPNDGMRKTVAARLTESKQTVPHFYLTVDCRIDALLSAREQINASAPVKDGKPAFKLSVNDFIIKAWAIALQRVPAANATWAVDAILRHKRSDVAVAVAVPGGLFTPVVKAADEKSLRQISEEVKDLAGRARSKKLAPHEYQGGATAVSNLGMYGIKHFAAVINPPHGTILAIGAGEERVFAENGQVKTGQFMTVTLSCDHRSVDGALGAEVLGAFKNLVENPIMMLA